MLRLRLSIQPKILLRHYTSKVTDVQQDIKYQGLYYYKYPDRYVLSFNKVKQVQDLKPEQIIGSYIKDISEYDSCKLLEDYFKANEKFINKMHSIIKGNLTQDQSLIAFAQYQKHGWIHINDERNLPPFGRIGLPEDIIGSVNIKDGRILEDTYQPMPTHRLITKSHGLFRLNKIYFDKLV